MADISKAGRSRKGSGKARAAGKGRGHGVRTGKAAAGYRHPDQTLLMRPEVGTQAQFRKKRPPVTYRYDSALSPALDWDGQNGARELGEWLLGVIERTAAQPVPHELPSPAEFTSSDGRVVLSVRSLAEAVDRLKRQLHQDVRTCFSRETPNRLRLPTVVRP